VNEHGAARSGEWAQHFSNASRSACFSFPKLNRTSGIIDQSKYHLNPIVEARPQIEAVPQIQARVAVFLIASSQIQTGRHTDTDTLLKIQATNVKENMTIDITMTHCIPRKINKSYKLKMDQLTKDRLKTSRLH